MRTLRAAILSVGMAAPLVAALGGCYMPKGRTIGILWPQAGINRSQAYRTQPPFTTADALNVRPFSPFGHRRQGGSRAGMMKTYPTYIASNTSAWNYGINLIGSVTRLSASDNKMKQEYDFVCAGQPYMAEESLVNTGLWHTLGDSSGGYTGIPVYVPPEWTSGFNCCGVTSMEANPTNVAMTKGAFLVPGLPPDMDYAKPYIITMVIIRNHPLGGAVRIHAAVPDSGSWAHGSAITAEFHSGDDEGDTLTGEKGLCIIDAYGTTTIGSKFDLPQVDSDGTEGYTISDMVRVMQLLVDPPSGKVTVFIDGTERASKSGLSINTTTNKNIGFGIYHQYRRAAIHGGTTPLTVPGNIAAFAIDYSTVGKQELVGTRRICLSGGSLFREDAVGQMWTVLTTKHFQHRQAVMGVEAQQKFFMSDFGTMLYDGNASSTGTTITLSDGSINWASLSPLADADLRLEVYSPAAGVVAGHYDFTADSNTVLRPTTAFGTAGGCKVRVYRSPKVYDPASDSVIHWKATTGKGSVPDSCKILTMWKGRMIMSGRDAYPQEIYMSRVDNPYDWLYGDTVGASQAAIALTTAGTAAIGAANATGDAITAIIPASDDHLLIACADSLWMMRGDPAYGGSMVNLSREIGVVDRFAWCRTPDGAIVFLSSDGLYAVSPGGYPQSLSRELLPDELTSLSPVTNEILMAYDVQSRGIYIWVTPRARNFQNLTWEEMVLPGQQWWFDLEGKGFWQDDIPNHMQPMCISTARDNSGTEYPLLGCCDSTLRRYDARSGSDDGTPIQSSIILGPIRLNADATREGVIADLQSVLDSKSAFVTMEIKGAQRAQGAIEDGTPVAYTTSLPYSRSSICYPRVRGCWASFKLSCTLPWGLEELLMTVTPAGKARWN